MRHERDFTPDTGAFFGQSSTHQQAVILFDRLPDNAFHQGGYQHYVGKRSFLDRLLRRPSLFRKTACYMSWLTGYYDESRVIRTAHERFNFPPAFTRVVIRAYDGSVHPAIYARKLIRAIRPGTPLALVAGILKDCTIEDGLPQALLEVLKAHAPYLTAGQLVAAPA